MIYVKKTSQSIVYMFLFTFILTPAWGMTPEKPINIDSKIDLFTQADTEKAAATPTSKTVSIKRAIKPVVKFFNSILDGLSKLPEFIPSRIRVRLGEPPTAGLIPYTIDIHNLPKAPEWVQELGHWAQDQMSIKREWQCDILIDTSLPPYIGGATVSNWQIVLNPSQITAAHGILVFDLLHESAHKAFKDFLLSIPTKLIWYGFPVLIGIAAHISAPLSTFSMISDHPFIRKCITVSMATADGFLPSIIYANMKANESCEYGADTAALSAMHCSMCVREASRTASAYRDARDFHAPDSIKVRLPRCGYLLKDAFIKRAEELEAHHEPLCAYHQRQQTISAILEKFKTPLFIPTTHYNDPYNPDRYT